MSENTTADDGTVIEQIPEDNSFRDTIADLRESGQSWQEVFQQLDDAYNPVDKAAYEESFKDVPEWEIKAIKHDENATSGRRYSMIKRAAESKDEAISMVLGMPDVIDVESCEQVDTVRVA